MHTTVYDLTPNPSVRAMFTSGSTETILHEGIIDHLSVWPRVLFAVL